MSLPEKFESAPPPTVTSAAVKSVAASLSVNVIVAVCPIRSEAAELVTVTVGATVSLVKTIGELAGLGLPAWSVTTAVSDLRASAPRFVPVIANST